MLRSREEIYLQAYWLRKSCSSVWEEYVIAKDNYRRQAQVWNGQPCNLDETSGNVAFEMCFSNRTESRVARGRTDDVIDYPIVLFSVAEKASLNGICGVKKMKPVTMQVSLKDVSDVQERKASRFWSPPCTILEPAPTLLSLLIGNYFVFVQNFFLDYQSSTASTSIPKLYSKNSATS